MPTERPPIWLRALAFVIAFGFSGAGSYMVITDPRDPGAWFSALIMAFVVIPWGHWFLHPTPIRFEDND